jgi:hypothetical protein
LSGRSGFGCCVASMMVNSSNFDGCGSNDSASVEEGDGMDGKAGGFFFLLGWVHFLCAMMIK